MSRIIANNIRHNDATVDSLSFDSSARVGIGEASPNRQLVVNGGTSEGVIQITNDTSGTAVANGFELIHFTNGETQLLNRENGAMRFDTNGTERMRLLSTGGLTFNGDTATANALDDYEEGTFTPTIRSASSATYTTQVGRYTKIGGLVWAYMRVGWSAVSGASYVNFSGLPFAVSTSNINVPVVIGEFNQALSSGYSYVTYFAGPSAYTTDVFAVQHKQDGTTADLPIESTGNVGLVVVYRV